MALNLGGIIRLTYQVKNDAGTLVNPSTATLTITQPDGTVAAGTTITLPPSVTGVLVYDFTPVQAGLHSVHWATTIPATAEDDMFVAERAASLLISVDEAVAHLNAAGIITTDAQREQLQWLCMMATEAVESDLGRKFVRRTITETYDGGSNSIWLLSTPVLSVTSVTESGSLLAASGYRLNPKTGELRRGGALSTQAWVPDFQNVVVVYIPGYLDPPRVVREVAKYVVQESWQASQQASHPLLDEAPEEFLGSSLAMLPKPLRDAYKKLRAPGVA